MEEKIHTILGSLEYSELLKLQKDLQSGGLLLQDIVQKKIFSVETTHRKVCASCGKEMNHNIDDMYTLVFGEKTIRKKASFCGLDCLDEFTGLLKDSKYNFPLNRRL